MKATTRKEQQAETRTRLMRAAVRMFCERGLEKASVEDVSREAGYTKGAFYANFRSKEELFLAMMDEKFAAEIERLDEALPSDDPVEDQIRNASVDYIRVVHSDPDWPRLFNEFAALATRDEQFREEFMTRYRAMRNRITELYRRYMNELGMEEPPIPLEQIVLATFCLANGFLTEQMLDPEVKDEEYGTMIITYFRGIGALLEEQDPETFTRLAGD
jgi:AcrR family transcriptional regulator